MKNTLLLLFLGLLCQISFLKAQDTDLFNRDKCSTRLLEAMETRSSEKLEMYVILHDQILIDRMVDSFNRAQTPVKERAIIINKELRKIAAKSQPKVYQALIELNIEHIESFWIVNSFFVNASVAQIHQISQLETVKYLDLNVPLQIEEGQLISLEEPGSRANGTVEPGIRVINAPAMWERGYTGYGRKAFVMDTGVDPTHPALARNYAGHAIPEDQAWFGFLARFDRPYDCQNHGSHVTGTILGIDRERRDTIGVAYNAMWTGAPILLVCGGNTAIRMAGFQWSIDPDDNPETTDDMPDVINNSWTDTMVEDCYEVYEQLLTTVEAAGIAVVFAAGNDGPGPATISQPKNINKGLVNSFAVGALNGNNLNIADFSSRGPSRCGGEGSLLIKPEVSAPGVAVRSCIPGNNYAAFNGTSMAAPHVAGAILLLKEAFPYLSGEEIKLALYFSARDLGVPGEDNVFGMGLIDVDAAFEYLVNQGHLPIDPKVEIDLVVENARAIQDPCSKQLGIEVSVSNAGSTSIQGIKITVKDISDHVLFEENLSVIIEPSNTYTHIIKLDAEMPLVYNYSIQVIPSEDFDERILNNSMRVFGLYSPITDWDVEDIILPDVEQFCGGTRLILNHPSAEGTLNWYASSSVNQPFATGNLLSLTLPEADTVLQLYAGMTLRMNTFSNEASILKESYLAEEHSGVVFLVYQDSRIESFSFECTARTFLNISLSIEGGTTLWSANRFYNAGEHIITPNAQIPAGSLVRLVIRGNQNLMGRMFENDHLYNGNGILSVLEIWNNEMVTDEPFVPLYNIKFRAESPCDRKLIELPVKLADQRPIARFSTLEDRLTFQTGEMVELFNESEAASQYLWRMGDGTILDSEGVNYSYFEAGEYTISLKAMSESGCIDMEYLRILIEEDAVSNVKESYTEPNDVLVYPNPAKDEIWVQSANQALPIQSITLISVDGRIISRQQVVDLNADAYRVSLPSVSPGFYIISINLFDGSFVNKKIVIY